MAYSIKTVSVAVIIANATAAGESMQEVEIEAGYECYGMAYKEDTDGGLDNTQIGIKDSGNQVIIEQEHKNILLMGSAAVAPNFRYFQLPIPIKGKNGNSLKLKCSVVTMAVTTAELSSRFIFYTRITNNC